MHITTAILAILATVALGIEEGIIRAPIIRNPNGGNPLQVAKRRLQSIQRRQLDKRDPFQAPLYNDQGSQYLIEVGIGSPAQTFAVTLDTGSADLWVPSTACPASNCPFSRFNSAASSTFKTLNKPFGIQYGIGSVNGTYATDTVTVGGATIPNQQFGLASITQDILQPHTSMNNDSSGNQNQVEANGILGMGYPSLTQANSQGEGAYNPFVFNLVAKGLIKEPVFSIYLNSISKTGWAGEITLGGIDTTKFDGDLTYLPVASLTSKSSTMSGGNNSSNAGYYYWMVYGQGLGVTNSNTGTNPSWRLREVGAYILDTGTTLTYLPTSVATEIVTAFAGPKGFALDKQSGVFIVDCATSQSPARFELVMSQSSKVSENPIVLSVPANELVIPIDTTDVNTATMCMFGIAPLGGSGGIGANMYLIGDSVLRSSYMVFDMGQNRVGLAATKGIGGTLRLNGTTTATSNTSSGVPNSQSSSDAVFQKQSLVLTMGALIFTAVLI
ncbi:aspartic peptidase domain-containing protein [Mucor mucedo]|uniref:aspartic peptidase domain-containing protein n=1 Tax=Mucor mucedo TaxID=29922 RepID=UPI00221FE5FA|nr:aspartic peptidase domain-containing protein [Mucor mucedo]KAI7889466.1 aspartic peptidase domain-containing protein [Mucor mucedo]